MIIYAVIFAIGFLSGSLVVMIRDRSVVQERMNKALSNGDRALYSSLQSVSRHFGI